MSITNQSHLSTICFSIERKLSRPRRRPESGPQIIRNQSQRRFLLSNAFHPHEQEEDKNLMQFSSIAKARVRYICKVDQPQPGRELDSNTHFLIKTSFSINIDLNPILSKPPTSRSPWLLGLLLLVATALVDHKQGGGIESDAVQVADHLAVIVIFRSRYCLFFLLFDVFYIFVLPFFLFEFLYFSTHISFFFHTF